ncbi:MAG: gliding motility-associated C-terminal domain-containing protein [Bacteroidia bacterium]|jgi:gliding motility-associated-like protein|nr:gliding motility-associated C-terminal domain-containing protein [Bacteroidia bacterium]
MSPKRPAFYFLLILAFASLSLGVKAQSPCAVPPNCIVNNEVGAPQPNGDMNSTTNNVVNGWYISHGTPTLFGNDCPTSTNNCSIWMWSYSGTGEGVFTCFNFLAGQTYELCLWVRNTNAIIGNGHLQIWMTNNFIENQNGFSLPPQTVVGQLIDSSFINNQNWTQLTFTITPTSNFNTLLIYPYMAGPPINNLQYELQIDDIRITPPGSSGGNYTISSTQDPIDWCSNTQLCVNNLPQGATVAWQPANALSSTTGSCVVAEPCSNTSYSAIISLPAGCANACSPQSGGDTLSITVNVNSPQVQLVSTGPAQCGDPVLLTALFPPGSCNLAGQWVSPNGTVVNNDSLWITQLNSVQTGNYVYQLFSADSSCTFSGNAISLDAIASEAAVYIPNTITPNSDDRNDFFTAYSTGFSYFNMKIFDRWGEMIFETSNPATGWNGTCNGRIVQQDTYVYVIEYQTDCSLSRRKKTGHVNIIR